jgi:hypothetical protein
MCDALGVVYGLAGGGSTFVVVPDVVEFAFVVFQMASHSLNEGLKYLG